MDAIPLLYFAAAFSLGYFCVDFIFQGAGWEPQVATGARAPDRHSEGGLPSASPQVPIHTAPRVGVDGRRPTLEGLEATTKDWDQEDRYTQMGEGIDAGEHPHPS